MRSARWLFCLIISFVTVHAGGAAEEDAQKFADLKDPTFFQVENASERIGRFGQRVFRYQFPPEFEPHPVLGYRHVPGAKVRHIEREQDRIIYNATYTFDEYSRRLTPEPRWAGISKHLILFGCSFTYGNGLNDEETLNSMIAKKKTAYYPYNYAIGASGPHMMLSLLQTTSLSAQIHETEGLFVYVYIDGHVNRALGFWPSVNWLKDTPYFEEKDGRLIQAGSFNSARPFKTKLLSFLGDYMPAFLRRNPQGEFPGPDDKDLKYVCRLISESKKEYLRQFPTSEFLVLIHPFSSMDPQLKECLGANRIRVIDQIRLDGREERFGIPGDGHPSALANQITIDEVFKNLTIEPI